MKELIQDYLSQNYLVCKKSNLQKLLWQMLCTYIAMLTSLVAILNHSGDHVNIFNTVKLICIAILF